MGEELGSSEASIRDLPPSLIGDSSNFDAEGFKAANKGKIIKAIVEQVRDGSTVRVSMLPQFQFVQVFLAGIQSPSMGRRPVVEAIPEADAATDNTIGEASAEAGVLPTTAQRLAASSATSAEVLPDPFGREAIHFTENRVLNRDGLAKYVEWSAQMMEEDSRRKLKAAELQAKKDRLRIWANYVPAASNSKAIHDQKFTGKVVEVVSGDCIIVADDAAPYGIPLAEHQVNLSSIRCPKVGNPRRNEKPEPYAREAKELLRSRLTGRQVNVSMEYSRKVSIGDGANQVAGSADSRIMDFGSVFLVSPSKESVDITPVSHSSSQTTGINVAELIVSRGLGEVIRHRDFEERSNYYDALLAAESRAKAGKKGYHSGKEAPAMHITDVTTASAKKARDFLSFIQRNRRQPAVVEYVLSGHLFKLFLPKETCSIAFSFSGVRCPD